MMSRDGANICTVIHLKFDKNSEMRKLYKFLILCDKKLPISKYVSIETSQKGSYIHSVHMILYGTIKKYKAEAPSFNMKNCMA